jgi:hypothetical protein
MLIAAPQLRCACPCAAHKKDAAGIAGFRARIYSQDYIMKHHRLAAQSCEHAQEATNAATEIQLWENKETHARPGR